ncbi:MAG: VWA domain-containing protein [Polyangiaceae bacterium]
MKPLSASLPSMPAASLPPSLSESNRPPATAAYRSGAELPPDSPVRRAWLRVGRVVLFLVATLVAVALVTVVPYGEQLFLAQYQRPWALVLLIFVPVLLFRTTFGEDRHTARVRVGSLRALSSGPRGIRVSFRDLPGVLRSVAFALLVVAMARPVDTTRPETTEESGIDLMLVLDLSGSMEAVMENIPADLARFIPPTNPGVPPRRIDVAKAVIRDFISRRKSDRIGVIVFGKSAYVLSPPTLDYQLLDQLVAKMELKVIDENGTAIGDALGAAVARLRHSSAKSKAVILLTDGDNNAGKIAPTHAAELATKVGAKTYPIQIGDGSLARVYAGRTMLGQPRFESRPFPVNPELLKSLASQTGGSMYVASDAKTLQASFHDVLDETREESIRSRDCPLRGTLPPFPAPWRVALGHRSLLARLRPTEVPMSTTIALRPMKSPLHLRTFGGDDAIR